MTGQANLASFIFNLSTGRLISANSALYALFNTDAESLTLNRIKQAVHKDDYQYAQKVLFDLQKGIFNDYVQLRLVIGQEVKQVRIMVLLNNDNDRGMQVYGTVKDITAELEPNMFLKNMLIKKTLF